MLERAEKMELFQIHYPKGPQNFTFISLMDRKSKIKGSKS